MSLYTAEQASKDRVKRMNDSLKDRIKISQDKQHHQHLARTLKKAYMFATGDMSITSEEMMDSAHDALSNLVGTDEAIKYLEDV